MGPTLSMCLWSLTWSCCLRRWGGKSVWYFIHNDNPGEVSNWTCSVLCAPLGPQPVLRVPSVQHHPVVDRRLLLLRRVYIYYLRHLHQHLTLWDPQGEPVVGYFKFSQLRVSSGYGCKSFCMNVTPQQSVTLRNMARFVTNVTIRRSSGGEFFKCFLLLMWTCCSFRKGSMCICYLSCTNLLYLKLEQWEKYKFHGFDVLTAAVSRCCLRC